MSLGQVMKQRQREIEKTATQCAKDAQMTVSEWSRWASGQSRRKDGAPSEPRRETLQAIAHALEMTATELVERAGIMEASGDVPAEVVSYWQRAVRAGKETEMLKAWRATADLVASV